MKLHWEREVSRKLGIGPATTQELAIELRKEGKLYYGSFARASHTDPGVVARCVIGFLNDWEPGPSGGRPLRLLSLDDCESLRGFGFSVSSNDDFKGTTAQRCKYMATILEAIA